MSLDKINARNWELLLNAVNENRVVPIIGDNLIQVKKKDGINVNVKDYVLGELSNRFGNGILFTSYSEAEDYIDEYNSRIRNAGDKTDIYYEIYEILNGIEITIPDFVSQFFKMCKFPLVLTTSYARGIEKKIEISSDLVKIYNKKMSSDILNIELDKSFSLLYYLFGRVSITKRSFKVTDDDLLEYLHCWHNNETRPPKLGEYLSDKFLLVLGCDYPNWLFRFFWYSIKNFRIFSTTSDMQGVVTVSNEFIDRFGQRIGDSKNQVCIGTNNMGDYIKYDVFVSYASEDYEIAKKIAEIFNSLGAVVWFYQSVLDPGEKYEKSIAEKIQECKRFVPILSRSTLQAGRRFFKKEWVLAIDESDYRLNEPYISPIVIDDIDPSNQRGIPKEFKKDAHIIKYNSEEFEIQIKKIIRSFR